MMMMMSRVLVNLARTRVESICTMSATASQTRTAAAFAKISLRPLLPPRAREGRGPLFDRLAGSHLGPILLHPTGACVSGPLVNNASLRAGLGFQLLPLSLLPSLSPEPQLGPLGLAELPVLLEFFISDTFPAKVAFPASAIVNF